MPGWKKMLPGQDCLRTGFTGRFWKIWKGWGKILVTAKDIFDAAKEGDELAKELVDELGEILGSALSNIACVVNPEAIVIGGGVSKAGAILIDTIQEHFQENAFFACRETRFELATLGNDAGIYGCAALVIE